MSVVALREHESRVVTLSMRAARALATHPVASISVSPTPDDGMWTVRAGSMVGVLAAGDITVVIEPKTRKPNIRARGYAENFATDRRGPWTH